VEINRVDPFGSENPDRFFPVNIDIGREDIAGSMSCQYDKLDNR
jgi:hypothetical protein